MELSRCGDGEGGQPGVQPDHTLGPCTRGRYHITKHRRLGPVDPTLHYKDGQTGQGHTQVQRMKGLSWATDQRLLPLCPKLLSPLHNCLPLLQQGQRLSKEGCRQSFRRGPLPSQECDILPGWVRAETIPLSSYSKKGTPRAAFCSPHHPPIQHTRTLLARSP